MTTPEKKAAEVDATGRHPLDIDLDLDEAAFDEIARQLNEPGRVLPKLAEALRRRSTR